MKKKRVKQMTKQIITAAVWKKKGGSEEEKR